MAASSPSLDTEIERQVAIKVVLDAEANPDRVARFLREGASILAFDNNAANLNAAVQSWDAGDRVISWVGEQ